MARSSPVPGENKGELRGLARGLRGHPGGRRQPLCLGGAWALLLLHPTTAGDPSLPLPSQTPVVLHEHLVINSIIIQLLLSTPKYIAQSKLAEIH